MITDEHAQQRPADTVDLARTTALPARGLAAYFLIAFGFSWILWAMSAVVRDVDPMAFVIAGSFGPAIASVVVTAATQGKAGVGALFRRYSPRRRGWFLPYLVALLPGAFILASGLIPVLLHGARIDEAALAPALASLPATFLFIALVGGGNEELGWRGFALPRLQSALPPFASNVALGIIWAVWHAPLWDIQGTSQAGMSVPIYVILVVTFCVSFGAVWNISRGGLLAVVIAHAAVNTATGLKAAALGSTGEVDSVIAMTVLCLLMLAFTKGRLGLPRRKTPEQPES
ncbi:type II CAAX endopeptidase family protein [Saccharopolyspora sp. NFXS83]|uniref:CPBP family intramembrane glutamic endopeptidase n=1 Tax=Saccharopolyspora sp. NFXS83 TaxID=2993560 RepID=UPI00224AE28D|nr:type II CAAX endopeptidase family protein [Saccharopolyspora sp. NFXS83]MCX2731435.1 type II CAAX endopeptidase family protein [Saccharopolyspora sp. NFXS83]